MRVAVAGSTGFIGSRVVRALNAAGASVVTLAHNRRTEDGQSSTVQGDLTTGTGLDEFLEGADAIIHCASYIGPDEERQRQVNVVGTSRLLQECEAAKVNRIVSLSTAAVYGGLPQGGKESQLVLAPHSELSRSRLAADQQVLEAGGTVVRPNAVLGAGDRWFLTPLLTAMTGLGAWVAQGSATLSAIDVELLGEVIAALATGAVLPGVVHAASPHPTSIRELVTPVYAYARYPLPTRSIDGARLLELASERGTSASQLAMVAQDNWYDTDKLWTHVPDLARSIQFTDDALAFYAQHLMKPGSTPGL